eukprot:COSAG05_NODE_2023_length_3681_cov_2.114182_2_plen_69_part_00
MRAAPPLPRCRCGPRDDATYRQRTKHDGGRHIHTGVLHVGAKRRRRIVLAGAARWLHEAWLPFLASSW